MNNGVKNAPKNLRSKVTKSIISDLNATKVEQPAPFAKLEARKAELAKKAALEARKNYKEKFNSNNEIFGLSRKERDAKARKKARLREKEMMDKANKDPQYIEYQAKLAREDARRRKYYDDQIKEKYDAYDKGQQQAEQAKKHPRATYLEIKGGDVYEVEAEPKRPRRSTEAQNARISWMNDITNAARSIKGLGKSAPSQWMSRDTLSKLSNSELWRIRGEAQRMATEVNASKKTKGIPSSKASLMKGNGGEKTTLESGKVRISGTKDKNFKRAVVSNEAIKQSGVTSLSVCSLCGSKEFNAKTESCPVCGDSYKKYRAVEAADLDWDGIDDEYTTIDIDGEEKVLFDEEGNTSVVSPDDIEGQLTERTHRLVLEGQEDEEDMILLDSGIASDHKEPDEDNNEFGEEPTENHEDFDHDNIAFVKIPMPIEECIDLFQEDNEDSIEVVPTDSGYEIIVALESAEEEDEDEDMDEEVEDDKKVKDAKEAEEPEELEVEEDEEADFEAEEGVIENEEEPEEKDKEKIVLTLEELAEGTVIHSVGVTNVDSLVGILNQLLEEKAEIIEFNEEEAKEESQEAMEEDIDELESEDEEMLAEDEELIGKEKPIEEAAKPKESNELEYVIGKGKNDKNGRVVSKEEFLAELIGLAEHMVEDAKEDRDSWADFKQEYPHLVSASGRKEYCKNLVEDAENGDPFIDEVSGEVYFTRKKDKSAKEAANPKFSKLIKAKRKRLKEKKMPVKKGELSSKVMESGTSKVLFGKQILNVKFKSVYEAKLPKVTKANPKGTGKVKAAGKPSAKSLAMTMENAKSRHEFMKAGQEALGSALNTRKLLLSLWDAIKENKPGSSKTLLNTLEAALKPKAVEEKKVAEKPKVKSKKLENKKTKKLDKVIKFSSKKE